MPDVAVHFAFGTQVMNQLSEATRGKIQNGPYRFALLGPDVWFMHKPWIRQDGRGRRMHTTRCGAFLSTLALHVAKSGDPDGGFSYLAGFLCHYALDATAHPYIIFRTTKEFPLPGAHRAFEHSLDICELQRQGTWGERHPMTAHGFGANRLPGSIRTTLDETYREVYGWARAWSTLNRAYLLFRFLYRLMENPRGLGVLLTRLTHAPALQSVIYAESPFAGIDVENQEHRVWCHSHDASLQYSDSFQELREQAAAWASEMIEAAYRYVYVPGTDAQEFRRTVGNRSYLSGLETSDPRNWSEASMLPSHDAENERQRDLQTRGERNT